MGGKIVEVRKGQHYKLEVRDDFSKEVTFKQKKKKQSIKKIYIVVFI